MRAVWVLQLCCLGPTVQCVEASPTWLETLPQEVKPELLWVADHESGDLSDWLRPTGKFPGSGVFNTGGADVFARATKDFAHSGSWSAQATITNAYRAKNGRRAVRLMAWTDRPWDQGGDYLPNEAYFSTWMMFPYAYKPEKEPPWDPGDGGWWNVFQFKSHDSQGESQPVWTLNVAAAAGEMYFYLYSKVNQPTSYQQVKPKTFAPGQWVHVEAYFRSAKEGQGGITVFQDGVTILDAKNVTTSLGGVDGADTHPIWGIGNYTDHIRGDPLGDGRATIYFDDAAISRVPLHPYVGTSVPSECSLDAGLDGRDLACACRSGSMPDMLDRWGLVLGDLDADGAVQFADFLRLAANFGQAVTSYADGDLDCSGQVSFADFLILSANFGSSGQVAAAIPEPCGFGPTLGALLLVLSWRRRDVQLNRPGVAVPSPSQV